MAKKSTRASEASAGSKRSKSTSKASSGRAVQASSSERRQKSDFDPVEALLNLLKSPLVADLLAVGATAAMAALTEARHSRRTGGDPESTRMMKAAGKAAAAAIGRRLATEFEEIRNVSRRSKEGAEA